MIKLRAAISDIAKTDMAVLVKGESGTGKEVVAQTIHFDSQRREKPFIKVNCAAIPKTLLESELFGFEKGAFTGANIRKPGKFELADGGTILLNDIGEINYSIQAKLLQVLQDGDFFRLGGDRTISVNSRVITTTKDHLEKSMINGQFRQDLFYRINVVTLTVPPLRDRKEQILPFLHYYLNFHCEKYGKPLPSLSQKNEKVLKDSPWPGNVRELENITKRLVLLGDEETLIRELTRNQAGNGRETDLSQGTWKIGSIDLKEVGKKAAEEAEKKVIQSTLQETHWNRKEAAKLLRVSYKAMLYKIQKYCLDDIKGHHDVEEEA